MPRLDEAVLLRVFVGEEDRYHGHSLCTSIVREALERHMAGATVLQGPNGFGASRLVRSEMNVDAGPRSAMVIEIVDTEDQINSFLPTINDMIENSLVTMERVRAARYRRSGNLGHPKMIGHERRPQRPLWIRAWLVPAS